MEKVIERDLPVYELEGIQFQVNVPKAELIEMDTPFNNIIKLNDLKDNGDHYVIHWNSVEKNNDDFMAFIRRQPEEDVMRRDFIETIGLKQFQEEQKHNLKKIPRLKDLDPVGMALHYKKDIAELAGKTDFEIMVNQEILERRNKGVLPVLHLGTGSFLVKLGEDQLFPLPGTSANPVEFSKIKQFLSMDGQYYRVPWNLKANEVARTEFHGLTDLPRHVQFFEFPAKDRLDPVGFFNKYGNQRELIRHLRTFPLKEIIHARPMDWSETIVPLLIERNIQKKLSVWAKGQLHKKVKSRINRGI